MITTTPALTRQTTTPKRKRGELTPQGRARAGKNAARHGLYAASIVIPGAESEGEWKDFRAETIESVDPVGPIESELAARIAELLWRVRRVARAEQHAIADAQHREDAIKMSRDLESATHNAAETAAGEPPHRTGDPGLVNPPPLHPAAVTELALMKKNFYAAVVAVDHYVDAQRQPRLLPNDKSLDKILRVEAHLGRQLYHALHELEALQQRRLGNALPLARVDVHGLPGT